MSWIQHGEIEEDGGQFGGDAQIGVSAKWVFFSMENIPPCC